MRFFKFICEKSCPRLDIGRLAGRLGQMDETRQVHESDIENQFDETLHDLYSDVFKQYHLDADKQKIENEAAIAKAEADKQVAITNAEAEAQKTSIAADAQAEANRKLAESLSDTLIDYQKIQKWDGKLPTVSGGNALVSIDPAE